MRKKIRLMAACLAATLILGGCGTPLYELSEEEEGLIVSYAAYALAKHNIYQKDGMTDAKPEETEAQESAEPETQIQETGSGDAVGKEVTQQGQETISLAEALGLGGKVTVTCLGSSVTGTYQEGSYFSVNAAEGKRLIVVGFQLENTGNKTVNIDTAASGCSFLDCFDGENRISEKMTFGGKILSSYSGKIKAKEKKKAYLIFEVPEDAAEKHTTDSLFVTKDGKTYPVKL